MKNIFFLGMSFVVTLSSLSYSAGFQYGGKTFTEKDFPPSIKQGLYDIEHMKYLQTQKLYEQAIFNFYIDEQAKKSGKAREILEKELLNVKPVTDEEAKKWFAENQNRIPPGRDFESLKGEVMHFLTQQNQSKIQKDLLEKVKKEKNFRLLLEEPKAPTLDIKIDGYPTKGPKKPKATLVEFADYTCGHCRHAYSNLKQTLEGFKDQVQFVYIHFPLSLGNGPSFSLAIGAACAEAQGRFWEYHDKLFTSPLTPDVETSIAKELKLDEAKFQACLKDESIKAKILQGRKMGEDLGVQATPSLFLNGQKLESYEVEELNKRILEKVR